MNKEINYTYLDDLEKVSDLKDSDALLLQRENKAYRSTAKTYGEYIVGDVVREQMETAISEGTEVAKANIESFANNVIDTISADYTELTKTINGKADYESGSWTPEFYQASNTKYAGTYYARVGYYRKVGKVVFVAGMMCLSTADVNVHTITGLPFVPDVTLEYTSINTVPFTVHNSSSGAMGDGIGLSVRGKNGIQLNSNPKLPVGTELSVYFSGYYMTAE